MIYSDEKDYVMRMIKEMARVIFSLAFGKTYVSVEMEKANKYRVSGKALNDLWEMIDAGQINEAENLLLEKIDYADKEEVMGAALWSSSMSMVLPFCMVMRIIRCSPFRFDLLCQGRSRGWRCPADSSYCRAFRQILRGAAGSSSTAAPPP